MEHQEAKYPEHKTHYVDGLIWGFAHMTLEDETATVKTFIVAEDGSSDMHESFEYAFPRRSHLNN